MKLHVVIPCLHISLVIIKAKRKRNKIIVYEKNDRIER